MTHKKYIYPALLMGLFIILILLTVPGGHFYGSYTDWLSQHVRLAETIRNACVEQKTLVPAFLGLGGGSNGYQFSYYGYLRPDILIGCLFPSVSMVYFIIGYMLAGYFCSVLICYYWLCEHTKDKFTAFLCSILFLTAGCFFQAHRQIMFVNYMPFLMLSLLCIKKKRFQFLPFCMLLIYLNSFYYSISCLAVIGWYWLRQDGKSFWKTGLFSYIKSALLSIGMASLLLIPTALVILEHRRNSQTLSIVEMLGSGANLKSLLYSPYGMGLTVICLYMLLLGLTRKKYRADSIMLLTISICGLAAWILNGMLYARAKILIPFVPLIILLCAELLGELKARTMKWKLWPCAFLIPVLILRRSQNNFYWIVMDTAVLLFVVVVQKWGDRWHFFESNYHLNQKILGLMLCLMPCLLFYHTAQTEQYVKKTDVFPASSPNIITSGNDTNLYRQDSLKNVLNTGNLSIDDTRSKSAMYSSIYNADYSKVYYETMQSPIQINNRLAILPSANPFLLNFLGIRYLNTDANQIPDGYHIVESVEKEHQNSSQSTENQQVLVENENVLPLAYVTSAFMNESQFESRDSYGRLDAITRFTIVPDEATPLADVEGSMESTSQMKDYTPEFETNTPPETVKIEKSDDGLLFTVKKNSTISLTMKEPLENQILLLDFKVINKSTQPVVIDINHMRNKLSGKTAPYPNGNNTFHYQFSTPSKSGLQELNITLSRGTYLLKEFNWHTYEKQLLTQKKYTSVENRGTGQNELLSCHTAEGGGNYFVTSIPVQKGLEIWVDGKTVPVLKLNQAFAGAKLSPGAHDISVRFHAPGKMAGFILTITCGLIYLFSFARVPIFAFWNFIHSKKELVLYCLSGGGTALVNYFVYLLLLSISAGYLEANTLAWASSVLTAYMLNRFLVFRSRRQVLLEFSSFVFLQFLILFAESILLWFGVSILGIPPLTSKITVTVIMVLSSYSLCKYKVFQSERI